MFVYDFASDRRSAAAAFAATPSTTATTVATTAAPSEPALYEQRNGPLAPVAVEPPSGSCCRRRPRQEKNLRRVRLASQSESQFVDQWWKCCFLVSTDVSGCVAMTA